MRKEFENMIKAMNALSEVWDESKVRNYPMYLPSFDDLIADMNNMLIGELVLVFDETLNPVLTKAFVEEGVGIYDDNNKYYPAGMSENGKLFYDSCDVNDMIYLGDKNRIPKKILEEYGRAYLKLNYKKEDK